MAAAKDSFAVLAIYPSFVWESCGTGITRLKNDPT